MLKACDHPLAFNWNESLAADELRTQWWTMIQVCPESNEANMHAHCSPDVAAVHAHCSPDVAAVS